MIGGGGSDTMFASSGSATLTGGAGSDFFTFVKGAAGGTDVITDFSSNDTAVFVGYTAASIAAAVAGATTSAAGSTITLSDNTKITFSGVSNILNIAGQFQSF
jgi:Ca2+-binding RTX toxin-like protein